MKLCKKIDKEGNMVVKTFAIVRYLEEEGGGSRSQESNKLIERQRRITFKSNDEVKSGPRHGERLNTASA